MSIGFRLLGNEPSHFSQYQQQIPGCFYFLGVRNEAKGITSGWHTDRYDVDERCLAIGVRVMANVVVDYLGGN